MAVKIYTSSLDDKKYANPIELGGTAASTLEQAAVNLKLATNSLKDAANGVPSLDSLNKLNPSIFPSSQTARKLNVEGSLDVVIGQTVTFKITDYDSYRKYTASVTVGTVTVLGDTITYTAPGIAQACVLTVGLENYNLNIITSRPKKPVILSPVAGSGDVSAEVTMISDLFVSLNGGGTHTSSDWQLATDNDFNTLVSQVTDSASNKLSYNVNLIQDTLYFARVRYKDNTGIYSEWSDTSVFKTKLLFSFKSEIARLTGSPSTAGAVLGTSISIAKNGNFLVSGVRGYGTGAGAGGFAAGGVFVYKKVGGVWSQDALLRASVINADAYFGMGVSISDDGTELVVSGRLFMYYFRRVASTWTFTQRIANPVVTAWEYPYFNMSSDFTKMVVCGATSNTQISYYTKSGTTWTYVEAMKDTGSVNIGAGTIKFTDDYTRFIISHSRTGTDIGKTKIYLKSGSKWLLETQLLIDGVSVDASGIPDVFINNDGTLAVLGVYYSATDPTGAVYFYKRTSGSWTQVQKIILPFGVTNLISMSIDFTNNKLVISTPAFNSDKGAILVYSYLDGQWVYDYQVKQSDNNTAMGFGSIDTSSYRFCSGPVALGDSAKLLAIGAFRYNNGNNNDGAVYLFA